MLRRRLLILLSVALLLVLAMAAYKGTTVYRQMQQSSLPRQPVSVGVTTVQQRSWQGRLAGVGSLKALRGVDLSLEATGTVKTLNFDSGEHVKTGQLLLQLDDDVEAALVGTAQADLGLAQIDYGRGTQMLGTQAISRSELDRLSAQLLKNQATVAQLKASLARRTVIAPFSGTIGIRRVDIGDHLPIGTVIATLQDLSSLYVDFSLAEQAAPKLALGQAVQVRVSAYPGELFEAKLTAINPRIEDSTRNILLRATLANPSEKLLPGMSADIQVLLPNPVPQTVVPESAIAYTLSGNSVYVVVDKSDSNDQPMHIAERRFIDTGEHREGWVVVTHGLLPGDRVVTSGQLTLSNGTLVSIVPDNVLQLDPTSIR